MIHRNALILLILAIPVPVWGQGATPMPWWAADVETALTRAKENRKELEKALHGAPANQRAGIAFLVANMPDRDLVSLQADFLLNNLRLAYQAREKFPWAKAVPEERFFNDVLPYASVTETREAWRKEMMERCAPLVQDCQTLTDAAQAINAKLFAAVKVRYSTKRNRPDQSPAESISTGMASCTGLSILLVDGCRSVGIPARVVGIPKWVNKPGNHTWVEIWDGDWHFTGACEHDANGLDRGWFVGDAALAKKDSAEHSIYATSFKRTNTLFPLVWAPNQKEVYAENVTDRYTRKAAPTTAVTRLMIRVWGPGKKQRLAVPVKVIPEEDPQKILSGTSRGETADTNDLLTFSVPRKKRYTIRIGEDGKTEQRIETEDREMLLVEFELKIAPTPSKETPLDENTQKKLRETAKEFFDAQPADRAKVVFDASWDEWLKTNEEAVRQTVWKAYTASKIHADLKANLEKNEVKSANHVSPYFVKQVGKKPAKGWPLFIAMHGGGGVPKNINDSQWEVMKKYYRDQASVEGYLYLALRAPNDSWNGFYDDYIIPLITNLIRQFVLFGEVDPDRVFIMGYSHGGYGAFFIGPKIPDRFAAVHVSAAAPTDGTISARSLRNTRFTFMIGENDTAYGRRDRCEKFSVEVEKLRKDNPGDYPVAMEFQKGFGHGGLPDRDKVKDMYGFQRNPVPKQVTWHPTDPHIQDFFWVHIDKPAKGQEIDVKIHGSKLEITSAKVEQCTLELDRRLVNPDQAIEVVINGTMQKVTLNRSLRTLCESVLRRGDLHLSASARIVLKLEGK